MLCRSLALLTICIITVVPLIGQVAVNDTFDRPDQATLGPDWMVVAGNPGSATIVNNRLQANAPFFFGWSAHTAFSAPYHALVVRADWSMNGGGGDRISIVAGADPSSWSGIEVRIADNDGDGLADRIFMNAAVNAGSWFGGTFFYDLLTPLGAGRVTLWFSGGGDTANVEILDPLTMNAETFSASGILSFPPTGNTVGIGYFGNPTLDDFQAWMGQPTGAGFTLSTLRTGSPSVFLITGATPSADQILAYSLTGAGPLPSPLNGVHLSFPIELLAILPADGAGRLALPTAPIPAGLTGTTIHLQALDTGVPSLTNFFSITVL